MTTQPKYNKRFSRMYGKTKSTKKNNTRSKGTRKRKDTKITRKNWMKKLIFTGGDVSHHAEHVFGGIGQQHAMSESNNAIHQNPLPMSAPVPNPIDSTVATEQSGGKKYKKKPKKH